MPPKPTKQIGTKDAKDSKAESTKEPAEKNASTPSTATTTVSSRLAKKGRIVQSRYMQSKSTPSGSTGAAFTKKPVTASSLATKRNALPSTRPSSRATTTTTAAPATSTLQRSGPKKFVRNPLSSVATSTTKKPATAKTTKSVVKPKTAARLPAPTQKATPKKNTASAVGTSSSTKSKSPLSPDNKRLSLASTIESPAPRRRSERLRQLELKSEDKDQSESTTTKTGSSKRKVSETKLDLDKDAKSPNKKAASKPSPITLNKAAPSKTIPATPSPSSSVKKTVPEKNEAKIDINDFDTVYGEYLQWTLIDARATKNFEQLSKQIESAFKSENKRLIDLKKELAEKRLKLNAMNHIYALKTWLDQNQNTLIIMGNKISEVKQSYEKFAASIETTTRVLPISQVHISSFDSVIEQIQVFTETVKSLFFSSNDYDSENIAKMSIGNGDGDNDTFKAFKVAEDLVKLYQDAKKEERLLKECMELQKASEQTSLLLISRELCNN